MVLQVPIVPKTPSQPKPSLMLPQPAHAAVAENNAASEENAELPATSARGQNDAQSTVRNQPEPEPTPVALRYLPSSYIPAASNEPSAKTAEPATKPASTKAQATARASFFTLPSSKPIAAQQRTAAANDPADALRSIEKTKPSQAQATARTPLVTQAGAKSNTVQKLAAAGNDLVDAPHSIVKPAPAESASRAPEPTPNEPPKEKGQKTTEQAAIAAPETSFPIRVSGPVAKPAVHLTIANPGPAPIEARANVQAPAEQDNSHAAILAASSSPSVSKSPVSKSPGRTARPDSKPLQPASTANGQTASPEPTPLPAPVVTPAPTSPSERPEHAVRERHSTGRGARAEDGATFGCLRYRGRLIRPHLGTSNSICESRCYESSVRHDQQRLQGAARGMADNSRAKNSPSASGRELRVCGKNARTGRFAKAFTSYTIQGPSYHERNIAAQEPSKSTPKFGLSAAAGSKPSVQRFAERDAARGQRDSAIRYQGPRSVPLRGATANARSNSTLERCGRLPGTHAWFDRGCAGARASSPSRSAAGSSGIALTRAGTAEDAG